MYLKSRVIVKNQIRLCNTANAVTCMKMPSIDQDDNCAALLQVRIKSLRLTLLIILIVFVFYYPFTAVLIFLKHFYIVHILYLHHSPLYGSILLIKRFCTLFNCYILNVFLKSVFFSCFFPIACLSMQTTRVYKLTLQ